MSSVSVRANIDIEDLLSEVSDKDLMAEMGSRQLGKVQALVDGLAPLTEHLDELEALLFRRDIQGALLFVDRLRDLPTEEHVKALKKIMREAGRPFV